MAIVKGRFLWPGAISPVSGTYTISHGISPGTPVLKCLPQSLPYAPSGELIITDNNVAVKIPGCKLNKVRREYDENLGYLDVLEILDWRWKWFGLGSISGRYNQRDRHDKLIPYTIQSPRELAILCLKEMGVTKYEIDLPSGLTNAQGRQFFSTNPPWIGVIPTTGTNPPVNWVNEKPAHALEQLCHQYGRRIVPRLSDYTVTIVVPGIGAELPPGSIYSKSAGLDDPETPSGVGVVGAPTKYQVLLPLEAVGEEWDGSYRPINELSYAPRRAACPNRWTITIGTNKVMVAAELYIVVITLADGREINFVAAPSGGETATAWAATLATGIGAAVAGEGITVGSSGQVISLDGDTDGVSFGVSAQTTSITVSFVAQEIQPASDGLPNWSYAPADQFSLLGTWPRADIQTVTERLTWLQAKELAERSVFKCYRITGLDADGSEQKVNIPGYGRIERRQQIILTDKQCDQVVPLEDDVNLVLPNGVRFIVDFYNGYSRDKPAAVYGSASRINQMPFWAPAVAFNTPKYDQLLEPFSVNAEEQMIVFNNFVYMENSGTGVKPPASVSPALLVLKTGVFIANKDTNEIERFKKSAFNQSPRGLTNFMVKTYEDIQLNVIGTYQQLSSPFIDDPPKYKLTGQTILEQDPIIRANYYLEGMKVQYFPTSSGTNGYNGFMLANLDGAIQQVTWAFSESGCTTEMSRNTEHDIFVAPYPARRRAEFLASLGSLNPNANAAQAAIQNVNAAVNAQNP